MGFLSGIGKAIGGLAKGVGKVVGGLTGGNWLSAGIDIFGGLLARNDAKNARKISLEDQRLQFSRLREAALLGGFNPLTALTATGGRGFVPEGGTPPLASIEAITGGLKGFADVFTGKAAQDRAREQLEYDLAKLQLETLQANKLARMYPSQATAIPGSAPRLGRAQTVKAPSAARYPTDNPLVSDRQTKRGALQNTPGVFEIDNNLTAGAVSIPGDTEPWGIDELATAAVVGLPQAAWNWGKVSMQKWKEKHGPFGSVDIDPWAWAHRAAPNAVPAPPKVTRRYDLRKWPMQGFGFDNYKVQ